MDESELVERLAQGDAAAFRELVERHKKKIYYLAYDMTGSHHDAEDISQTVFLKVFRSFGTFQENARLTSWLYRITYNACLDHLRKKAITPQAVADEVLEFGASRGAESLAGARVESDPGLTAERRLLQHEIRKALDKVSPQERAVFLLRHENDLKLGDIAEILGLSVGSVKSYLFRAVRKLREELSGYRTGIRLGDTHG